VPLLLVVPLLLLWPVVVWLPVVLCVELELEFLPRRERLPFVV